MQETGYIDETGREGRIHWPAIADPMVLLDELERRLDHCETTVTTHLEDIQRRLDRLERDVAVLHSTLSESQLENEKQVVALAQRLTKLESH